MNNDERPNVNYADMKLAELKSLAKEKHIKGFSTMKKADLIAALEDLKAPAQTVSFIEGIKAAIQHAREVRSSKGRKAAANADVTPKMTSLAKISVYRLQRGSETARMTAKQRRRVRKTERSFLY